MRSHKQNYEFRRKTNPKRVGIEQQEIQVKGKKVALN
jgi:hypothetical protein